MPAYPWVADPPPPIPGPLAPVPASAAGRVDALLDSAVAWVLRRGGLLAVLDRVTGDGPAVHAAAAGWREGALEIREVSSALREGASRVGDGWDGAAAEAFGGLLGTYVAIVDDLCVNTAAMAVALNRAGIACSLAERLVVEVVADAAAWAAAELAATAVADVLTLGLATVAGAVAESATLAVFVERAAAVSAELAMTLDEVAAEVASLKTARTALRDVGGFAKLRKLHDGRRDLERLPVLHEMAAYLEAAADVAVGQSAGLPLGVTGAKSPAVIVGQDVGRAGHDYLTSKRKY